MRSLFVRSAILFGIFFAHHYPERAAAQIPTPQVSPDRVLDVADGPPGESLRESLKRFDDFSWRAFIALNWPAVSGAANRGDPDRGKTLGDRGPRVWETWKARFEVFAPNARTPAAWQSYDGDNPCPTVTNDVKTLSAYSHFADFNQAAMSLRRANPLVAQNRTYTRYEARINKEHFDTIVDDNNRWYIKARLPTPTRPGKFKEGAIAIKAAWRILNERDPEEVRNRFYVTKAMVFDPDASAQAQATVCTEQMVALVGLHIVIKTEKRPQWIWSSFEHVDNVPPRDNEPVPPTGVPYSYNSGGASDLSPPHAPPAITPANYRANPDPMEVVRKRKIDDSTMATNRAYWALPEIRDTVWKNYMLVMTQWPSYPGEPGPANNGTPFPRVFFENETPTTLVNTTLETYLQDGQNCMDCHHAVANSRGMDFVAFMAFDAADPLQNAISRSIQYAGRNRSSSKTKGQQVGRIARTALDDDPSVRALVRFLRQRSAGR